MDRTIYQKRTVRVSTTGGTRLTAKQTAEKIGIAVATLYSHLRNGNILRADPEHPAFDRVPAEFFEQDVDVFIAQRKTKTTQ